VSYIVIHDDTNGVAQYKQFESVDSAADFVERLRNSEGVMTARIFDLMPVAFEMKPYFKVEIGTPAQAAPVAATPAPTPTPGPAVPAVDTVGGPEILTTASDSDMVYETLADPIETIGSVASTDESADPDPSIAAGSEARRGLFGR
jgi:hypothetical protein